MRERCVERFGSSLPHMHGVDRGVRAAMSVFRMDAKRVIFSVADSGEDTINVIFRLRHRARVDAVFLVFFDFHDWNRECLDG